MSANPTGKDPSKPKTLPAIWASISGIRDRETNANYEERVFGWPAAKLPAKKRKESSV